MKTLPVEQQVVSLNLSKQLAELLGDNAPESLFVWRERKYGEKKPRISLLNSYDDGMYEVEGWEIVTPAYTTAELSYFIGQATNGEYVVIEHDEGAMAYHVYDRIMESEDLTLTRTGYKLEVIKNAGLMAETAVDTWAKLAIYLLKHNLLPNK